MQPVRREQFVLHRRHATGAVERLAEMPARRLHVDEQRHVVAVALPVADVEVDAYMAGDGVDVDRRVGRAAERGVDDNGVLEGPPGHDRRGTDVLVHQADGALAGVVGHRRAGAVGRGNGGAAGQRHAERLGERIHRRRRAHGVAVAGARHLCDRQVDIALVVEFAGGVQLARLPVRRAGTGKPVAPVGIEHRSARQDDRRDVDGRRRHQAGRHRLVAAGGQHDAVERVAVQDLDESEIGEVAVERGGRPAAGFLDRVDRKDQRDAAAVANAVAHPVDDLRVDEIAGAQFAAGLGDTDDRLALELMVGNPLVFHPTTVHKTVLISRAKPFSTAQRTLTLAHEVNSLF